MIESILINSNKRMRELRNSDIFETNNETIQGNSIQNKSNLSKTQRIKKYRMQEEYGEKKFIKP